MPSDQFAALPKVELHVHAAGSVRPATMREFVEADGLDAQLWREYAQAGAGEGLPRYLRRFAAWDATVRTPERTARVIRELRDDLAADGVVYGEPRLRPPTDDDVRWDDFVSAAVSAADGAERGSRVAFIAVLTRGWATDRALREARRAARWANKGIIGLDVSGDETIDGAAALRPAIGLAREAGLRISVHAGEAAGPASVRQALRLFEPERIAHGVRAVEDPELVGILRDQGIHLEMALRSNVQTGCVKALAAHPFKDLLRGGVSVGLNTDNRTISGTSLSAEYGAAADTLRLTRAELAHTTHLAAESTFLTPAERAELSARIAAAWSAEEGR